MLRGYEIVRTSCKFGPGAGADVRTKERGAEMEAPPRGIGAATTAHTSRSPFDSVPRAPQAVGEHLPGQGGYID